MRSPAQRGRARALLAAAMGGLALASCLEPTAGQVDLPGLDQPVEKKLSFAEGKELSFPVHVDSYDYAGGNYVVIDVTLLRGGAEVGRMSCQGFELEGGAGCGSGATHLNSDCSMKVPAGGADAIRAVAKLQDKSNRADFKGLSVYIRD
jgi:hypothetical protein